MGSCQSSSGKGISTLDELSTLEAVLGSCQHPAAIARVQRQSTDRLLVAKAVAAEFDHPKFAAVDEALLGVMKRDVWEFAHPGRLTSSFAELLQEPVKTGPTLEDYYGYEPVPGIERNIARRRVEDLLAQADQSNAAWLLRMCSVSNWTTLDWHRRRELLERQLFGKELSWLEVVRKDMERRK